jgi:hypothetical protein
MKNEKCKIFYYKKFYINIIFFDIFIENKLIIVIFILLKINYPKKKHFK